MNILITGGWSRLAHAITDELSDAHNLRLLDSVPIGKEGKFQMMDGSILDAADARQAVRGMDALIHTGEPPPDFPEGGLEREQMMLDLATRGTHTLFSAAIEAGVERFIYAGSLSIFEAYPDDIYISEFWKPRPSPEITQMTKYLGELTCREFARDHMVTVTALRLGELVLEEEVRGKSPNPLWLDLRDAAQAFSCALNLNHSHHVWWTQRWAIYHICADISNPKFLVDKARQIGYLPTHNFQELTHPEAVL